MYMGVSELGHILLSDFSFGRTSILIATMARLVGILTSITFDSFCLHPFQHLFSSVCDCE